MSEKLNFGFDFPLDEIERIIGVTINGDSGGYERVVSPRALIQVHDISLLREDVVRGIVGSVCLRGTNKLPYLGCEMSIFRSEPYGFKVGQTFILEDKILGIMENLEGNLLSGFPTRGISKLPPLKIYGQDAERRKVIAFYLPPIVEHHDGRAVLIDGMHRNYICSSSGTTINAVHIYSPNYPLPFDPITWKDTKVVKGKPPKDQRYINLRTDLFRDLGSVGIDG